MDASFRESLTNHLAAIALAANWAGPDIKAAHAILTQAQILQDAHIPSDDPVVTLAYSIFEEATGKRPTFRF